MKSFLWFGIIGLVFVVCSCATKQKFSNADAHWTVVWSGDQVTRIACWSDKLPEGFLVVDISRGHDYKKVLINSEGHQVWSRNLFTRSAETSSGSGGIVFHGESTPQNAGRLETEEWKLETNGLPLYKEVRVKDENGLLKEQQFFGTFGVALKPPK